MKEGIPWSEVNFGKKKTQKTDKLVLIFIKLTLVWHKDKWRYLLRIQYTNIDRVNRD